MYILGLLQEAAAVRLMNAFLLEMYGSLLLHVH